ncbi:TPA: hypothetical protein ACF94D_005957, partial [Klebsiella michiganensis]
GCHFALSRNRPLYSHLSFHTEGADQERFSRLYHSLRDWACEHDEKEAILAAID